MQSKIEPSTQPKRPYICSSALFRTMLLSTTMLLAMGTAVAQTPDPTQPHRTVETQHFRISFTPSLEPLVAGAARSAERAYTRLQTQVGPAPGGRIDLLLSDASDLTNGFATPLPSNRITVFVNPPVEILELQNFHDWLDLVITHELAHTFHLETTGTLGRFVRGVFGRVPLAWPVFPAGSTPRWAREGLAVEIESLDGTGRIHGSFHEMVVRTAILENGFDPIDRVSHDSPRWPDGQRAYIYGSLFLDYITRTHGANARQNIVRKTGGSILPPELAMNRIARNATGHTFTELWRDWELQLRGAYTQLADSLRSVGLTTTEPVAGGRRHARHPRVSPDGRLLAFAEETGREVAHTRVIDLATLTTSTTTTNPSRPHTSWSQRRTGIGPSSWLQDNRTLLTAQVEFNGRYRTYSDVYTHSQTGEARVTNAARMQDPDVNRAGTKMVAVKNDAGRTRLVLLAPNGDSLRAITTYNPAVAWSSPRWSPDGSRIAVARWQNGNHDIVVVDTTGQVLLQLSDDAAVDAAPAWSPDGHYVLFWSDRTGIPNIFAVDVASPTILFQVTNVLTGAYDPDVSPDARYLYFAAYHADGFRIERTDYNPASWRPARVATSAAARTVASEPRAANSAGKAATDSFAVSISPPRTYNPLHTLRPYYWLPLAFRTDFAGTFIGASTAGRDLLGRHAWSASLAVDPSNGRTAGGIGYSYARFGKTTLGVSLLRDWDYIGRFLSVSPQADTSIVNAIEREDVAQATAQFVHRRIRSAVSFTIGAELVRRSRIIADSSHIHFRNPSDQLWGPIARLSFANTRAPAHAISPESGVALQVAGRLRNDVDTDSDRGYTELTTWNTAYKAFDVGAFAHHVIAVRFSGLLRDGNGATPSDIGGVPGTTIDLGPASIGDNAGLLPIRGFEAGDRFGTRAWTASVEYRIPFAFPARGYGLWPVFLDRVSASVFADAGNADCPDETTQLFRCPAIGNTDPLTSIGAELITDLAVGFSPPVRARMGLAHPLTGPRSAPRLYLAFGTAF